MGGAVVGPYAAEIVGGGPGLPSFEQWLAENHFMVPDAVRPALQFYESRNFSFVVLHLRPGVGVQQMQPVRVTTHAYAPTLPLRMVAAGVAEKVGLNLMVLASSSMRAQNYDNLLIPEAQLSYDFAAQRSNYRDVFDRLLAGSTGRAWVIESVQQLLEGLIEVGADAGAGFDAGNVRAMDGGAPESDGGDAGTMLPMGPTDPLVDRRVAFAGLNGVAKLTRLRTQLSPSRLDADLTLEPNTILTLGPTYNAATGTNIPPCPGSDAGARDAGRDGGAARAEYSCRSVRGAGSGAWLIAAAVASLAIRRARSRS